MKILISMWSLQIGGTENFVSHMAIELKKKKHEVYLYVESDHRRESFLTRLKSEGVKILCFYDLWFLNLISWKLNALFKFFGFKKNVHKLLKDIYFIFCVYFYKIQVISSHSAFADSSRIVKIKNTGRGIVFTDHGEISFWIEKNDFFFREFLEKVDATIAVSEAGREILSRYPAVVIYNGVKPLPVVDPLPVRNQLNINAEAFVFGMIARSSVQKGWLLAIEAFQQLQVKTDREVHMILVGINDDFIDQHLRNRLLKNVHIFPETDNPSVYLSVFDAGLTPSCFYEGLPTTIIEYLYAGKPVIASRLGGIPEILAVEEELAGELIELDSARKPKVDQLVKAMVNYVENPAIYFHHKALSISASKRFDFSICVEKYEHMLMTLIQ